MSELTLFHHPLSSYCWKALLALYENGTRFAAVKIDLGNPTDRAVLAAAWSLCKFPVLRDEGRGETIPEASIIIEYLGRHYPGAFLAIPADGDAAIETRLMDRIFDNYVMTPMQAIVFDRIRPEAERSPADVARARALLATSYDLLERRLAGRTWAAGEAFTLADCAAAPSLYYADRLMPFRAAHPVLAAYMARLEARPSFARVLEEAAPYMAMFPG